MHLFGRLELSASRYVLMDHQLSTTAMSSDYSYWDKVGSDFETLTLEDFSNGNSDFEYAWTEMMKIMVPVTVLRMVPRTGDRGTAERKRDGEKIQEKLRDWERNLPPSFQPIAPPEMMFLEDGILSQLEPIYYISLNVAIAMGTPSFYVANVAHHSALQINVFGMTHRGDEPRPQSFYDAVQKTLQICLGVQRMRQLGMFHVPDGGDYGILWPIAIAAIRVPRGELRSWVLELLSTWPREGMLVPPLGIKRLTI